MGLAERVTGEEEHDFPGRGASETDRDAFRDPRHEFSPAAGDPRICWKCKLPHREHLPEKLRRELAKEGAADERAKDAGLVRAAGCVCRDLSLGAANRAALRKGYDFDGFVGGEGVLRHDPRCPVALAARIEAGE